MSLDLAKLLAQLLFSLPAWPDHVLLGEALPRRAGLEADRLLVLLDLRKVREEIRSRSAARRLPPVSAALS